MFDSGKNITGIEGVSIYTTSVQLELLAQTIKERSGEGNRGFIADHSLL